MPHGARPAVPPRQPGSGCPHSRRKLNVARISQWPDLFSISATSSGSRLNGQSSLRRLREVIGDAVKPLLVLDPCHREVGNDVGPIAAIGRRIRVSIPNCQGQLAEWFIGRRGQVQHGIGKSPNRRESEPKRRKAPEAMAEVVKHRLINFIGGLERIQQSDVRWHSGGGRRIVPIAERLHQRLGLWHQHDQC